MNYRKVANNFFKTLWYDFCQLRALVVNNFHLQLKSYKANCIQIALPILCLVFLEILQLLFDAVLRDAFDGGVINPEQRDWFPVSLDTSQSLVGMNANVSFSNRVYYVENDFLNSTVLSTLPKQMMFNDGVNLRPRMSRVFIPLPNSEKIDDEIYHFLDQEDWEDHWDILGSYDFRSYSSQLLDYSLQTLIPKPDASNKYFWENSNKVSRFFQVLQSFTNSRGVENIILNGLMDDIHSKYIQNHTNLIVHSFTQQIPYEVEEYEVQINLKEFLSVFFFPLILTLVLPAFMYKLIIEKKERLKEMMLLMGMKYRNYVISNIIHMYIIYIISAIGFIIMTLIFQYRMMTQISPLILIILFIGIGIVTVGISFCLSSFTSNEMLGVVVAYFIVLVVPAGGFLLNVYLLGDGEYAYKPLLLLLTLSISDIFYRLSFPCQKFHCVENADAIYLNGDITVALVLLYVSGFMYLILGLILEVILPQKWGREKWFVTWFKRFVECLYPKYWFYCIYNEIRSQMRYFYLKIIKREDYDIDNPDFEFKISRSVRQEKEARERTRNLDVDEDVRNWELKIRSGEAKLKDHSILIKGLTKKFGDNRAVDKVSFGLKKNSILSLLGPNGSGKTTLMRCLTGLYTQSEGDAYVSEFCISSEMSKIRSSIGYCPQHDLLFPTLTARQTIMFYTRLKGFPISKEKEHVEGILKKIGLITEDDEKKGNLLRSQEGVWNCKTIKKWIVKVFGKSFFEKKVKGMSAGERRRLQIGCALAANPKLLILDEPTTGLDLRVKHLCWKVIMESKKYLSVLISTHSMEEADVISDNIAVMSRGKLICYGSPIRLKSKFGKGYQLGITYQGNRDKLIHFLEKRIKGGEKSVHEEETSHSSEEIEEEGETTENEKEEEEGGGEMLEISDDEMISNSGSSLSSEEENLGNLFNQNYSESKTDDDCENSSSIFSSDPESVDCGYQIVSEFGKSIRVELQEKQKRIKLSSLFNIMNSSESKECGILDFMIDQPTLEKVFLNVIKKEERAKKMKKKVRFKNIEEKKVTKFTSPPTNEKEKSKNFSIPCLMGNSCYCCCTRIFRDFYQLRALLHKNFRLLLRGWITQCCIIFSPVVVFLIILLLGAVVYVHSDTNYHPKGIELHDFESYFTNCENENNFFQNDDADESCISLAYSTNGSSIAKEIMTVFFQKYQPKPTREFRKCEEMENYFLEHTNHTILGLCFFYDGKNPMMLDIINYNIYYNSTTRRFGKGDYDAHPYVGSMKVAIDNSILANYYRKQQLIPLSSSYNVWNHFFGVTSSPKDSTFIRTTLRPFPTPPSRKNGTNSVFKSIGSVLFTSTMMALLFLSVFRLVKEKPFRDALFHLGLPDYIYCLSWYCIFLCIVVIMAFVVLLSGMVFQIGVFVHCNPLIILSLFFLFGMSMITLGFTVSLCLPNMKVSIIVCFVMFAAFALFNGFVGNDNLNSFLNDKDTSQVVGALLGLLFPSFDFSKILFDIHGQTKLKYNYDYEEGGGEGKWKNVGSFEMSDLVEEHTEYFEMFNREMTTHVSLWYFAYIIMHNIILLMIYFTITCCFSSRTINYDKIRYYFCCGFSCVQKKNSNEEEDTQEFIEKEEGSNKSIVIKDLEKTYFGVFKCNQVLKGLNISVERNSLVSLLANNAEGKTTTIECIIDARNFHGGRINFFDSKNRRVRPKRNLGVCYQQDIQIENLTAFEHMFLICYIKCLSYCSARRESKKWLKKVGLYNVRHKKVRTFSGGMKRRLSLAMSCIKENSGDGFIFLDECTTGLDPYSVWEAWELIFELKKTNSIFLTTHSMEEAEVLSDKIGIMKNGRIICFGNCMFLKERFGAYYLIHIMFKNEGSAGWKEQCESFLWEVLKKSGISEGVEWSFQKSEKSEEEFGEEEEEMEERESSEISRQAQIRILPVGGNFVKIEKIIEVIEVDEVFIETFCLTHASLEDVYLRIMNE